MHGIGKMCYADGDSYFGDFVKGKRHGIGMITKKDGKIFESAEYKQDEMI